VDAHAPGVSLGKVEEKMGIKASDTRTVTFENVRVPAEDRLGEVGQGFKIALEILNTGRLGLAAGSAHGARRIMTWALQHAKTREQFGRPIGSFEMIQNKIARIASRIYAADSAVMLTAGMMDRGGIDFSLETAACKVFASELAVLAANEAMQIAGGIGYSKEYPYEQALRDSRINMIFEGTNEILRALIALSALQEPAQRLKAVGSAFRDPLHSIGTIGAYVSGRVRRAITTPPITRVHPSLRKQADRVSVLVRDLALATESALMRHEKAIMERQFIQERMADAAIGIYLSLAVLVRTTREIERAGVERVQPEIECARTFLADTNRYVRRKIRQIGRNQDTRLKSVAERALETQEPAPLPPYDRA
jgi:acyl-CoA dehydrogenase family protein 9